VDITYRYSAVVANAYCLFIAINQHTTFIFYFIVFFHNINVATLNIKAVINKIMNKLPIIFCILLLAVFLSGCVGQDDSNEKAKADCMQKCNDVLSAGQDISNGPCLDNKIIEGWVCDVAHSPRQAVDDDPTNQCQEFGKTAFNFIEVDTSCNFIRAYP
jgi:hypothetical protein